MVAIYLRGLYHYWAILSLLPHPNTQCDSPHIHWPQFTCVWSTLLRASSQRRQSTNKYVFILREVNKLRNAVAHNSCVLCDLNKKNNNHRADTLVISYLKDCGVGKENRNTKLSNSRIRQITYTLYIFNIIISSKGIRNNVKHDITKLFQR